VISESVYDFTGGSTGWHNRAACRGMDPEIFFPARGEPQGKARAVCAVCPVREECGAFALANGEKYGIWGGMSERERRKLRRGGPPKTPTFIDRGRRGGSAAGARQRDYRARKRAAIQKETA